jgi:hypothetical protein
MKEINLFEFQVCASKEDHLFVHHRRRHLDHHPGVNDIKLFFVGLDIQAK